MTQHPTLANWSADLNGLIARAEYLDSFNTSLGSDDGLLLALGMLRDVRDRGSFLYVVGNGGSAAIASHAVNDFLNVGRIRALALHDPALLTCMANDYGYAQVYAEPITRLARPGDLLVAISSSGRSPNIHRAAEAMRQAGGAVVTLSGFEPANGLRALGDLNIYLPAHDYGLVELGHQVILHYLANVLSREGIHLGANR